MNLRRKTVTDKESERVMMGNKNGKEIRRGTGMRESRNVKKLKYRENGKRMALEEEKVRKYKID